MNVALSLILRGWVVQYGNGGHEKAADGQRLWKYWV
jgi:hypothetical protein